MTWGKIASWGVAAAMTAASVLAAPPAPAVASALAGAGPLAGYTPISTGQGMCLDATDGPGRDGQPVQLSNCLGDREQAWQAEPDGTIRNGNGYCLGTGSAANRYAGSANGTRLVMVDCSRSYRGSYWTVYPADHQIVNKYAVAAMDNRDDVQRDGNPVQLWQVGGDRPGAQAWTAVPSGGGTPAVTPGEPPDLHVDRANMVTSAGQVFVPRGFTLSTLQHTQPYLDGARAYDSVLWETEAQIDAIAGAWHGNIVRLQVEQDDLVKREAAGDHSYLNLIRAAVSYAKAKGLVAVLNAQTEPGGRFTRSEPLPTLDTVKFWLILQPYYGDDASVIIDAFNEPRPLSGTSVKQYMALWKNGGLYKGVAYLGHQQLAEMLRADGYATNMLWVEPPGNYGLAGLVPAAVTSTEAARRASAVAKAQNEAARKAIADPGMFLLNGVPDVSYSFHHPTVLGVPRTRANWDAQFGDLVRDDELSVNDGEWATRSQYTGHWAQNGDSGPCWSDAPSAVPRYFAYLQHLGLGMTVWTLSDGGPGLGTTAASDPGTFTTTATMGGWPGCVTVAPVRGPGGLIMAWFGRQAS